MGKSNFPCDLERKADPVAAAKESLAGFDDVVTDAMKKFEVPGMAIAIVKNKKSSTRKASGCATSRNNCP